MKIEFIKLHEGAKTPIKKKAGDFCYDLYAAWVEEIDENYLRYHSGIAVQIARAPEEVEIVPKAWYEDGYSDTIVNFASSPIHLSLDVRPRSSVWETGLILANCEGTIDEGYTGEICLVFFRADKSKKPYEAGDRIAQVKIGITFPIAWEEVHAFQPTEYNAQRGSAGFGSSGRSDAITEEECKAYQKQVIASQKGGAE